MDINQLIQFQTTARYENLTKAAAELYITQSALSKSIRQLENELHTSLFDRHGKTITLNSSGEIVLKYTNHIIEMVKLMDKALSRELCSNEAQLNLATNRPLIAHSLFPKISVQHPELTLTTKLIDLDCGMAVQLLNSGIYDLLITNFPIDHSDIASCVHSEEAIGLCVTKDSPLAVREKIQKEDLKELVLPATQYSYDTTLKPLQDELREKGISFTTFMVSDIATINYLMKISDMPSVFTDVAWSFSKLPNRVLVEIEGISHKLNYINYLKKNESRLSYLINLFMTEYKDFSDE